MKTLVLGCGHRKLQLECDVIRLDINPSCHPDVVWDLTKHPLPFQDEEFNAIHAQEVLEHLTFQGDYEFFFREFNEYWRILKMGGTFEGWVPMWNSSWAFGDPGHKRVIQLESLIFLDQRNYTEVGKSPISDYRDICKCNFRLDKVFRSDKTFHFILIKYERIL